jgi:dTMP kinase
MNARRPRGRFIVLEGIDGSGTTTQVAAIARGLRTEGHTVFATHQPSEGPIGTLIRQVLTGRLSLPQGRGPLTDETLALMFAADRLDHLAAAVMPAIERGEVVVCDRYLLSSLAYQGSTLPVAWVEEINKQAMVPDLKLFLDLHWSVASERRKQRGGAAELYESDDRQKKIADQYLISIQRHTDTHAERIIRIDGEKPVDRVTEECLVEIHNRLFAPPRKTRA